MVKIKYISPTVNYICVMREHTMCTNTLTFLDFSFDQKKRQPERLALDAVRVSLPQLGESGRSVQSGPRKCDRDCQANCDLASPR